MKTALSIIIAITFSIPSQLLAEANCAIFHDPSQFGPFDFTHPDERENLPIVESYHFTKKVENLVEGQTASLAADIDFTLRAFPNHHRALDAMSRLSIRDKTIQPIGANYTTFCYFIRAVRFKPNDAVVQALFGNHFLRLGESSMALQQFLIAVDIEPNNPMFNYNIGLLYFDEKDYIKAKAYAKKAYAQDFPLPGLMNKLKNVGKW